MIAAQPFGGIQKLICLCGIDRIRIEEFFRSYAEIVANIEENRHRRIVDTILDIIDVAGALTNRQTHIPCRCTLLVDAVERHINEYGVTNFLLGITETLDGVIHMIRDYTVTIYKNEGKNCLIVETAGHLFDAE